MADHPTQNILDNYGRIIPIDRNIANLIAILWRRGYKTNNSCQDNFVYSACWQKKKHFVWICFDSAKHASRFMTEYIGTSHDRLYSVQGEWEISMPVINTNTHYDVDEDMVEDLLPFKLEFSCSVRFPTYQLKDVQARFAKLDNKK